MRKKSRLRLSFLPGQTESHGEPGQRRSKFVGNVPDQLFLGVQQNLNPLGHAINIGAQASGQV
jgi:hypothetical protein